MSSTKYLSTLLVLTILSPVLPKSPTKESVSLNLPLRSQGEGPRFYLDFSNFLGRDNRTYVEFYFQIGYPELQFFKHKGKFRAGYDLNVTIFDQGDHLVERYKTADVFEVETYRETQSATQARVSLVAFTFDPEDYRIKAVLTDFETGHSTELIEDFSAKRFSENELKISDVQLSQKITPAQNGEPYVKNERYIEPNPIRAFVRDLTDHMYVYFEVYNLAYKANSGKSTYTAEFLFYDREGNPLWHLKRRKQKPGPTSAHSMRFPLDHFSNGEYTLTVRVTDDQTGSVDETTNRFVITELTLALSEPYDLRLPH